MDWDDWRVHHDGSHLRGADAPYAGCSFPCVAHLVWPSSLRTCRSKGVQFARLRYLRDGADGADCIASSPAESNWTEENKGPKLRA